jgi:tetratricopeptide (TPR) repeat protein
MPGSSLNGRRRLKGIAIRPEAVRQARLDSGLSLAELAGGQVTRAAIHLVETGKMRPSMRTLQLIAQRTGRPISYFMADHEGSQEQRVARDELLRLVDEGAFVDAIAMGAPLLDGHLEPGLEADVRFALGRAHVQTVEGELAMLHLARARQLFERIGDSWMAAHALLQEGLAMFLVEDPRTLPRALEALDRCELLQPTDPALTASVFNLLGSIHMRRHDWRAAVRFFEMGLQACANVVSLRQVARLHDGLSTAYQRLGDFGAAVHSAERASALYATETDQRGLIRAENNLGYVLLRQGELGAAAAHLHRALALCDQHDVHRRFRSKILNSIAELHLARNEPERAEHYLLRALEVAAEFEERDSEATAHQLLARARLALGDGAGADRSYAVALDMLQQLRLPERLRDCAMEYADLLHRRGRLEDSIGYWRIAATAGLDTTAGSQEAAALLRQSGA